jgi:hypothetical protein
MAAGSSSEVGTGGGDYIHYILYTILYYAPGRHCVCPQTGLFRSRSRSHERCCIAAAISVPYRVYARRHVLQLQLLADARPDCRKMLRGRAVVAEGHLCCPRRH